MNGEITEERVQEVVRDILEKSLTEKGLNNIVELFRKEHHIHRGSHHEEVKTINHDQLKNYEAGKHFLKSDVWPVGSVFISVVSTDPHTLLGFGTWSAIAEGRMLVGLDSGDADFNEAEETGGAKTKDLEHDHKVNPPSTTTGVGTLPNYEKGAGAQCLVHEDHTHDVDIAEFTSGSGGSATQDVMNPYFVVYIWKRTA